jgi:hypothetical protein
MPLAQRDPGRQTSSCQLANIHPSGGSDDGEDLGQLTADPPHSLNGIALFLIGVCEHLQIFHRLQRLACPV